MVFFFNLVLSVRSKTLVYDVMYTTYIIYVVVFAQSVVMFTIERGKNSHTYIIIYNYTSTYKYTYKTRPQHAIILSEL